MKKPKQMKVSFVRVKTYDAYDAYRDDCNCVIADVRKRGDNWRARTLQNRAGKMFSTLADAKQYVVDSLS